ncbi:hypothetical protein HDE76_003403 [Rhodanobacter sp. ANJX3]|uniref:hypothetical protein n=1 Tax=Rhodanobacter sp. ANJX3 TaxID=2723083 RepID=UPI001622D104|nr:hypothetical protein [Rhodanobacter sp. ANJX3]MBB5360161.1 hypothetical protein [Rhodanobacter sp. ANJX3]
MSDKVIDVHLGFMDEEVNTVLNGLRDKEMQEKVAMRRPAVMIERSRVDLRKTDIKAVKYAGAQLADRVGEDVSSRAFSRVRYRYSCSRTTPPRSRFGMRTSACCTRFIGIATDLLKECADLPASSGGIFAHTPAAEVLAALAEAATLTLHRWVTIALQARSAGVLH